MSLVPQDMTALLDHDHIWLLFCITEVYLAFADGTVDCVYRQWFLNLFLSLFSNFNDRIMQMSDAVSYEGRRARTSYKGLRPYPLSTEICPVSLNLLMMLCTVDDEICKAFAIWCWGMLFLKYSILLCTLSQIGEPLPIFTSERLCLSNTSFYS